MWVLLSSQLRTWVLLAVAVPAARHAVRYARQRVERDNPDTSTVKALRTADSVLARVDRRSKRHSSTTTDH